MKIGNLGRQCVIALAPLLIMTGVASAAPKKIDPAACVDCHDSLDVKTFQDSIHGGLDCTDCHTSGPFGEHEGAPPKVNCGTCHGDLVLEYEKSVHGLSRAKGNLEAPACADCHGDAHLILPRDDSKSKHTKANIPAMCARCHADLKIVKKFDIPVGDPFEAYKNSVHGRALAAGNMKAAVCSDCHGSHSIQPGKEMSSATAKRQIPKTCGRCHSDILKDYEGSVHGAAVLKGSVDAPSCADCHGEHAIFAKGDPNSPVSSTQVAAKTCTHCHTDLTLARRYGFKVERVSSFSTSYHGLAVRRGATSAANCASCHGIHNIRLSSDPASSIHPTNLPKTCGSCHPGTSAQFANVPVHLDTSPEGSPVLHWVRTTYLWLIFGTIGFMLAHNLLIFLAAVLAKLRAQRKEVTYVRFDTIQLISHFLLAVSFTSLVVTGFALRYPEAGWTVLFKLLGITEEIRRVLHRVSAVTMLVAGVAHIAHSIATKQGKYEIKEMIPKLSDVREAVKYVFYWFRVMQGRATKEEYPKMGRYTYIHKVEYWALIWGTVVMSVTGFALWFPEVFSRFLPAWGVPLMEMVHYYEAWLATLAILIWHFFFTIFHPHEYPMSVIWLSGKVTREEMEHEHPRELEAWEKKAENKEDPKA